MSNAALKILREILKRDSFDGAYYLCGEDDFQKESAMNQLIAGALDMSVRDFNLDVRRAQDIDARSFDALVSSMPMLSDRRVVVIREVGSLRKEGRRVVEHFLERPFPGIVLLLVETAGAKTDKGIAAMATTLEFDSLAPDRIPRWIAHYATTELNTEISSNAAELLQAAVGNDLHQLVAELEKLASFTNGEEITENAVTEVVGVRRGETMADLLDVIARRDVKRALELADHVLGQPKTTTVLIIMALSTQAVALGWGRARLDEGLQTGRLQGEYFALLKQSGNVYTGRSWSTAAAAWTLAVNSWDKKSVDRALEVLLAADVMLKETRLSSEEQVLTSLILAMCAGDEHQIAA
jgi:DNA polymerase III subunit delta